MSKNDAPAREGQTSGSGQLLAIYEHLLLVADPVALAIRRANACGRAAEQLEHDALSTGAMKNDVRVMLRFRRRSEHGGSTMEPFLV